MSNVLSKPLSPLFHHSSLPFFSFSSAEEEGEEEEEEEEPRSSDPELGKGLKGNLVDKLKTL